MNPQSSATRHRTSPWVERHGPPDLTGIDRSLTAAVVPHLYSISRGGAV